MSLGSVSVDDDGVVTKSGLCGGYYDAIYAQEFPLLPDSSAKPDDYPGTDLEWYTFVERALTRMKKLWGRQATAAATGLGISAYAEITADVSTSSASYTDLLTATLTSRQAASYLLVIFTASCHRITNLATNYFQIVVDGVAKKGCYVSTPVNYGVASTIMIRVPVVAGAHVVKVQWKTDAIAAEILAATAVEEHANLFVQEVA